MTTITNIDHYKSCIIQIATPHSRGTGFVIADHGLIVTNEHVVRDNQSVIIRHPNGVKALANVVYLDSKYDIAFLSASNLHGYPSLAIAQTGDVTEGNEVIAMGHPFGLKYTATKGIISSTQYARDDISYILHDAALNPGNSGGPLIDHKGRIIGVNTFVIDNGNSIGFSLPASYLLHTLDEYQIGKGNAIRCCSCETILYDRSISGTYCPTCGSKVELISNIVPYEPAGVSRVIERILERGGYDVALSRMGPRQWSVDRGSARIDITYHEKSGLITGDAYLCLLPTEDVAEIYKYMLHENYRLNGLTLSTKGQDIILSLLVFDQYLNEETFARLSEHLFQTADDYDNILVEEYGARWRS